MSKILLKEIKEYIEYNPRTYERDTLSIDGTLVDLVFIIAGTRYQVTLDDKDIYNGDNLVMAVVTYNTQMVKYDSVKT